MPNQQQLGREREVTRKAAEAKELPKLTEALGKLSLKQLANEEACFASLSKDFPAVGRNAFHDAYVVALDAADATESKPKKESGKEARSTNTGGEGTKGGAATPTASSGTKPPSPPAISNS